MQFMFTYLANVSQNSWLLNANRYQIAQENFVHVTMSIVHHAHYDWVLAHLASILGQGFDLAATNITWFLVYSNFKIYISHKLVLLKQPQILADLSL